jgi:1,4-dihydroxy-6-naphthoate synthase
MDCAALSRPLRWQVGCKWVCINFEEDRMPVPKSLSLAYTPDSDDAFYYDALEAGYVCLAGFQGRFFREPISILNRAALLGVHHVTAISSIIYSHIADRYAILGTGTSVGRGYGPVLVSKRRQSLADVRGCRVGVGGIPTTGWFLLRWLCPEAEAVEMPFDRIADAVAVGQLDAGIMIHEELLYYPQIGLHRVADLGAEWCQRHALPLPVGLNVIRRDLGDEAMLEIASAIRRSLQHALDHPQEALARVRRFGRGPAGRCTSPFVAMFANQDSLCMPADVRTGLRVLLRQVVDHGLGVEVPSIDIIDGVPGERESRQPRAA